MIKEDYVSFETAKLLEEKGFDVPCEHYYAKEVLFDKDYIHLLYTDEPLHNSEIKGENINFQAWECTAPTLQMAIKWLREEHKIFITIGLCTYPILNKCTWIPQVETLNDCYPNVSKEYDTYEEACEAAIKYCLENLI